MFNYPAKTNSISYANHLVFEITRRCNMKCPHCLRGKAEDINIKKETIFNTIKNIDAIGSINFSGGEPSLYPRAIKWTVEALEYYKVSVDSFCIVTNGKKFSRTMLDHIEKLYDYIENSSYLPFDIEPMFKISKDIYHEESREIIRNYYEYDDYFERKKLYGKLGKIELSYDNISYFELINEGYAKKLKNVEKRDIIKDISMDIDLYNNNISIDSILYINALGDIIPRCDLSFATGRLLVNL